MVVNVFSYPQVVHVTLDSLALGDTMITSSHATNPLIRLFRNTDQRLDVLVKNYDRRPVLFEEWEVVRFRVFDKTGEQIIDAECELVDFDKGHYRIDLTKNQTGGLTLGHYTWCIIVHDTEGDTVRILYTDRDYGGNAPLKVVEGPEPMQQPPTTLDPDALTEGKTSALPGAMQTPNTAGTHSLVLGLTEFSGTVRVEGTIDPDIPITDQEWVTVSTVSYDDVTGSRHIGFAANLHWVRFVFSTTAGLDSISYRNR